MPRGRSLTPTLVSAIKEILSQFGDSMDVMSKATHLVLSVFYEVEILRLTPQDDILVFQRRPTVEALQE